MKRLLLFGGTTEGRQLAVQAASLGYAVTVCVATEYGAACVPDAPGVAVHTGRLEEDAMEALMRRGGFSLAVDATHPYAADVSRNIRAAAGAAGLPCLRLLRPESGHAGCLYADTVAGACALVPPGNLLAATGSKEIAAYMSIPDYQKRVYARVLPLEASVAQCREAGLPDDHILAARGPFTLQQNLETLRRYAIRSMVTKDGGTAGGFPEKLEAARLCGVQVILVRRPHDAGLDLAQLLKRLEELA